MDFSSGLRRRECLAFVVILLCSLSAVTEARSSPVVSPGRRTLMGSIPVSAKFLVPEPPLILTYHNGPILTGAASIPLYVVWYGNFSESQCTIVKDFLSSTENVTCSTPSVSNWWKMTGGYKNADGVAVPPAVHLQAEICDSGCKMGKNLLKTDIETIVTESLTTFPSDPNAVYLVLTASDVIVEDFCTNECGSHYATIPGNATSSLQLPYAWVGNPADQCPGKCAWPFAQSDYGPYTTPLLPPNGDVGIDGMLINVAAILAGAATNPFNSGFYQGDGGAPLEAATACTGIFGAGAYSGYAGQLMHDDATGQSYNALGINNRRFLLPALWDPVTLNCTSPY